MAHILIIDDEPMTCEILAAFLRLCGHTSADAHSCQGGRDKLLYERPDLILLDYMLPDGNGVDFCRELRAHPGTAATPIVMISAYYPPVIEAARSAGATDYLTKPITFSTLKGMLKALGLPVPG